MNRRTVLERVGTACVVGSLSSGCLRRITNPSISWTYDAGGDVYDVVDGTLYAREHRHGDASDDEPVTDGEIVALEAATGDLEWRYGAADDDDRYAPVVTADGVFVGSCDEYGCTGPTVLELDGEERWQREVGVGDRLHVVDGVVYVASEDSVVRAFDAASGEERWTREVGDPLRVERWDIVDVTDAVYLESNDSVVALDREHGERRWRHDLEEEVGQVVDIEVATDTIFVLTEQGIAAVADGERLWYRSADTEYGWSGKLVSSSPDRLYAFASGSLADRRLHAFDVASGDLLWESDPISSTGDDLPPAAIVHGGRAYLGSGHVRELDLETGEERWRDDLDRPVLSLAGADGASLVVHQEWDQFATYDEHGERTWQGDVPGRPLSYLVDDSLYVGTDEGIYAVDYSAAE